MSGGTTIHPSAVVGPGVELGVQVSIGPYAVLTGPMRIGDRVWIGSGCALGGPPEITSLRQNLGWTGDLEHHGVVIEDEAVLREHVVVHQGSRRPTVVGTGSWLLNRCYLAHDVQLGAGVTVSAGVSIGGHCEIRAGVNLGMNASVHQGRRIGARSMVGMGATVTADVPPFAKVYGVPLRLHGVNAVGMRRAGFEAAIPVVARAYAAGQVDLATTDGADGAGGADGADGADVADGADGAGTGLPPELLQEFRWWAALEDRRPVRNAGATPGTGGSR